MDIVVTDYTCKICNKQFNNLRGLSQHVKAHGYTALQYMRDIILENNIPKCKCGCGADVTIRPFKYQEYRSGHNPNCFWQNRYDKNSDEYKSIVAKISKSVTDYLAINPLIITDELKKIRSIGLKKYNSENPDAIKARSIKMRETKRKQSEAGILSDRHWTKVNDPEFIREKLKEAGEKSSATKKKLYESGTLVPWNKGLDPSDARVAKISGINNYNVKYSFDSEDWILNCSICSSEIKFDNRETYVRHARNKSNAKCNQCKYKFSTCIDPDGNITYLNRSGKYNKSTIPYIVDILDVRYGTTFIHSENSHGEFKLLDVEMGRVYYADAYCPKLNLWVEFDEPYHFRKGKLRDECVIRQERIQHILKCDVVRINFSKIYNKKV